MVTYEGSRYQRAQIINTAQSQSQTPPRFCQRQLDFRLEIDLIPLALFALFRLDLRL